MIESSKKEEPRQTRPKIFDIKNILPKFFFKEKSGTFLRQFIEKLKPESKKVTMEEERISLNLREFSHKTVAEVMIPRSEIHAVKLTPTINELLHGPDSKILRTRTLVYDGVLDNIVGYIHIKDIFKLLLTKKNLPLKSIVRTPIISAHSTKLIDLLTKMRRQRVQISVVIDEYGGTDGIVTVEDIMEEIFGRIDDEHDIKSENDSFQTINSNTVLVSARLVVEEIELALGVRLKEDGDEFDTIGGLVLAKVGSMPKIGTKITINDQIMIEVIDADPRSLKKLKVTLLNGKITNEQTESAQY